MVSFWKKNKMDLILMLYSSVQKDVKLARILQKIVLNVVLDNLEIRNPLVCALMGITITSETNKIAVDVQLDVNYGNDIYPSYYSKFILIFMIYFIK